MKIKILALLMVLVMAVGIFASCSGTPECTHVDKDDNNLCDNCGESYSDGKDVVGPGNNDDNKEEVKVYPITWEDTPLIFKMTKNSNKEELPSTCDRYLEGDTKAYLDDYDQVDIYVAERNALAYDTTSVVIDYKYFEDIDAHGWSQVIDLINKEVLSDSSGRPDMYCNFVYDMVSTSLKGSFANLYSKTRGENYFEFNKSSFEDTGKGYMYEYMRSLTLSKDKMYCLSSDYFTDMVRAFFVVPVNITLLQSIAVDDECLNEDYNPDEGNKFNSDRDGDQKFTISDFYDLVWDKQWNYEILAQFSSAIYEESGEDVEINNKNGNLTDTLGFAVSCTSGLSSSGMLYTTTVKIIDRKYSEETEDFTYAYPTTNADLETYCENLYKLFDTTRGVIAISDNEIMNYGTTALTAIRNRFAYGSILFGGAICLGSLEYNEYKLMNTGEGTGFGIVPVPLYRVVDPKTGEADDYQTQIHNIGRIGAISATTEKFSQCSAFLDYQSLNSTHILDEYYNFKLQYNIAGGGRNVEMLQYIRYNVRSSFDKAFEDAIGRFFTTVDPESDANKWHNMIMAEKFLMKGSTMSTEYARLIDTKIKHLESLQNQYGILPD